MVGCRRRPGCAEGPHHRSARSRVEAGSLVSLGQGDQRNPPTQDASAEMLLDLMKANGVEKTVLVQVIHTVGTTATWPMS